MIVRWGLAALPEFLAELSARQPLLITTARWANFDLPITRRFAGAQAHGEITGVRGAIEASKDADWLVALGGGAAIDTAKATSSQTGLPILSIPTTYSGAEWTPFFGNRDKSTGLKSAGSGAKTTAILYEPELTLDLPREDSGATALNAMAHCVEALSAPGRSDDSDRVALRGAALIARWLPLVLENGHNREARRGLLEGAMHGGEALRAGMGLGHAMAQALGGMFGVGHGQMNAVCLPLAMRFNTDVIGQALASLSEAMQTPDPVARCQALAEMSCPVRLRDYNISREKLGDVAAAASVRPAAKDNPRPVTAAQIQELLESVW